MRQEDIGRDTITIHSGNTKTRRTRVIPIAPGLRQWLKHVPLPYKDYEGHKERLPVGQDQGRDALGEFP